MTKLLGVLLGARLARGVAVASRAGMRPRGLVARQPLLAAALGLFIVWAVVSLVWATDLPLATESVNRFVLNFALFPIALAFVVEARHVVALFAAFVAASVASVAYGLLADPAAGSARRDGSRAPASTRTSSERPSSSASSSGSGSGSSAHGIRSSAQVRSPVPRSRSSASS